MEVRLQPLGKTIAHYGMSQNRLFWGVLVLFSCIMFLFVELFPAYRNLDRCPTLPCTPTSIWFYILIIAFVFALWHIVNVVWNRVEIYEHGISVRRLTVSYKLLWTDIIEVEQRVFQPLRVDYVVHLRHSKPVRFSVGVTISSSTGQPSPGISQLVPIVLARASEVIVHNWLKQLRAGQSVELGGVTLTPVGLQQDSHTIAWEEITQIQITANAQMAIFKQDHSIGMMIPFPTTRNSFALGNLVQLQTGNAQVVAAGTYTPPP
jgi:hypothetical protein